MSVKFFSPQSSTTSLSVFKQDGGSFETLDAQDLMIITGFEYVGSVDVRDLSRYMASLSSCSPTVNRIAGA